MSRASYGKLRNNDVTSPEREVTMMLHHDLRTDAQICGKVASQASLFVHHGRDVNMVYIPYSRRGHDGQKERLGLQIYRKFARQYVNCDVTSFLLHVPVT